MLLDDFDGKRYQRALVDESGLSRNCPKQGACHTFLKKHLNTNKFQQPNRLFGTVTG
jgi:hypothetical protein